MTLGEIGGLAFLGVCALAMLIAIVRFLPGDVTRWPR